MNKMNNVAKSNNSTNPVTVEVYDKLKNLYKDFNWFVDSDLPILHGKLPDEILNEFDEFTCELKKLKDHRLNFLKQHINAGQNQYQASVPSKMFEQSFAFPYLIRLGENYLSRIYNTPMINLADRVNFLYEIASPRLYSIWANFSEKNSKNGWHSHTGALSGVIYVDNSNNLPTEFEDGSSFNGQRGDIVIFPAPLPHRVEENNEETQRITYSFNLIVRENDITGSEEVEHE